MTSFDSKTKRDINHYVYMLVDPRNNEIFYVGRGVNNRVFDHEKDVKRNNFSASSPKEERIREILSSGKDVKMFIVRHGLTRNESRVVESVLINVLKELQNINFSNHLSLTNIQDGEGMKTYGLHSIQEIEALYASKPLTTKNLKCNVLSININKSYSPFSGIYDPRKGEWKVNICRAQKCKYVLSEYQGVVREIFKVDRWKSTSKGRASFIGEPVVDEKIRKQFINKLIFKQHGTSNPLRYFEIKKK